MSDAAQKTILLLSTYPIARPKHGGQVRLAAIKKVFKAAGWRVVSIAVYEENYFRPEDIGPRDIPFPKDSPYRFINGQPAAPATDLLSGIFACAPQGGLPLIFSNLPEHIDAIHVEQPWLWPLAQEIRKRPEYASAIAIYGSANIEAEMMRGIMEYYDVRDRDKLLDMIGALERRAAGESDLALAVTREDAAILNRWREGKSAAVIMPNGIEPWQAEQKSLAKWQDNLPKYPWLLYVSSAHAPNFSGFAQIFNGSMGCFHPLSRLVVAGSVSEPIYRIMKDSRWADLNFSRMQFLGTLSDQDLAAVKTLAHGFILPIQSGGGSNIKTAEALYSGAYVIGTKAAFRGYEQFVDLPEVKVCADAKEIQQAVKQVIADPKMPPLLPGSERYKIRQNLCWDTCLAPLPALAAEFLTKLEGRDE